MPSFKIADRLIGDAAPVYFIADISANHDGSLDRAKELIHLAKEAGADAAKFQHFRAPKIVSECGFQSLGSQLSHQANWKKSVVRVYEEASLPWEWTAELKAHCDREGVDFFSTPYDFEAANMLDPYVDVYKVGSGDITWIEFLEHVAAKHKPMIVSTGASDMFDVERAVEAIRAIHQPLAVLQCNTNYTGSRECLRHVHLNVLRAYASRFPGVVLGLSDHTPGHAAVLGAVALGAKVIEKHFTDDPAREGPDHPFSMDPLGWAEMVACTRDLQQALGSAEKFVAENENETIVVQRRCLRAARALKAGTVIERSDIDVLRPAPARSIAPYYVDQIIGRRLSSAVSKGKEFTWEVLEKATELHGISQGRGTQIGRMVSTKQSFF